MNEVNLNIDELHDFVGHIITNNRHLQTQGKKPVAIEVVGESGIGKWVDEVAVDAQHKLGFQTTGKSRMSY